MGNGKSIQRSSELNAVGDSTGHLPPIGRQSKYVPSESPTPNNAADSSFEANSPVALARKFSLSSIHSPTSSPTHRDAPKALVVSEVKKEPSAAVTRAKGLLRTLAFLPALFGGKSSKPAPMDVDVVSDEPIGAPSPASPELSPTSVSSKREMKRWIDTLSTEMLWGFSSGPEAFHNAVKKYLAREAVEHQVFEENLTRNEAMAIAMFTSRTGLPSLAKSAIDLHFHDPMNVFNGTTLSIPALTNSETYIHASFLSPLLSALPKLTMVPTATIMFCVVEKSVLQRQDDLQSSMTLPTIMQCSEKLPEAICAALGGYSECRILCVRSYTARRIGAINMSVDAQSIALHGDEYVLLPGWKGRIVGTVQPKWKKMISAIWEWDVTSFTLMEVVEDGIEAMLQEAEASGSFVGSPSSSPRRGGGAKKRKVSIHDGLPPNAGADATSLAFMANPYLVDEVSKKLKKFPRDTRWNLYLGLLHSYATGRYDAAIDSFERVISEKPDDHSGHMQLGLLYDKKIRDYRLAKKHYEAALRTSADNAEVYYLLGSLHKKLEDYTPARRYLEAALRLDPRHVGAHAEYGWILEHYVCDFETADQHYDSALRMDPNHAEANFCVAYSAETRKKDYKAARRLYTLCIACDPTHVEGHYRLGLLLDEHFQNYPEAVQEYLTAIKLNPRHSDAHHQVGFLYLFQLGQVEEARRHFLDAIQHNPKHADAHNHLGYLLWKHDKNWPLAKQEFRTCLACDAKHVNGHSNLAKGLSEEEKLYHEARTHFEEAIKLDPTDCYLRTNLAALLLDHPKEARSDYETAKLHLEVAVTRNPTFPQSHYHLSRVFQIFHKDFRRAKSELEITVKLDETYADAHNDLGYILETKYGRRKEAKEHYERAVQLEPTHVAARNNLGLLLQHYFDDPVGARAQFEAALDVNPGCLEVQKNLAKILLDSFKDYRRAKKRLEEILRLDPTDVPSMTLLGTLFKNKFKDFRRAKHYLEEAHRLSPLDINVLNALGLLYYKQLNKPETALEYFEKVVDIDPNDGCASTNIDRILNAERRRYEYLTSLQQSDDDTDNDGGSRGATPMTPTHPTRKYHSSLTSPTKTKMVSEEPERGSQSEPPKVVEHFGRASSPALRQHRKHHTLPQRKVSYDEDYVDEYMDTKGIESEDLD